MYLIFEVKDVKEMMCLPFCIQPIELCFVLVFCVGSFVAVYSIRTIKLLKLSLFVKNELLVLY